MSPDEIEALKIIPAATADKILGCADRTREKWEIDPDLNFPKFIEIRGRKFYRLSELKAWIEYRQTLSHKRKLHWGAGRNEKLRASSLPETA
jgi:hypothetical protein